MTNRNTIEAELVADTRNSEQRLGFRNVASAERRLLFRTGDAYIELRVPPAATETETGGWLYGQFILPDPGASTEAGRFEKPIYAVLQGSHGVTGAVRTTDMGDFAVPFSGAGDFVLNIEPATGPIVQARFHQ
jgi:hypothetical protein